MSQLDFYTVLDHCIARIQAGEPLASCLADYPDFADELRPLLTISADLVEIEPLAQKAESANRGRDLMFAAFDEVEESKQTSAFGWLMWGWEAVKDKLFGQPSAGLGMVGRVAIAGLAIAASGGIVAGASANSLPGDGLYPVKRFIEDTRLSITLNAEQEAAYQNQLNDRRLREIQLLQEAGRAAEVEFSGQVESIAGNKAVIEGIEVQLSEAVLDQGLAVGEEITISSQVDQAGIVIITGIEQQAPDPVIVPAVPSETQTPTATPSPSPTKLPTVTPTTEPTVTEVVPIATDQPTSAPTATATSSPTQTPTDIPTERPTETPSPTQTATAVPTARATSAPEATPTRVQDQRPTETPRPTEEAVSTPRPTSTPQIIVTQQPTQDVRPTSTPIPVEPTSTPQPEPSATPIIEPTATRSDSASDATATPGVEPTPTSEPTATRSNTEGGERATATPVRDG
ncbi:MAG: DUF5667 domain-containing protein [Chloroflexota bacterium]